MPATQISRSLSAPSQSTADDVAMLISDVTGWTVSVADVADQMRQVESDYLWAQIHRTLGGVSA